MRFCRWYIKENRNKQLCNTYIFIISAPCPSKIFKVSCEIEILSDFGFTNSKDSNHFTNMNAGGFSLIFNSFKRKKKKNFPTINYLSKQGNNSRVSICTFNLSL